MKSYFPFPTSAASLVFGLFVIVNVGIPNQLKANTSAPVDVILPAQTIYVTTPARANRAGGAYRVGPGGELTLPFTDSLVYIDSGGLARVEGDNNSIFVAAGGQCIVTGKGNRIVGAMPNAIMDIRVDGNVRRLAVKGFNVRIEAPQAPTVVVEKKAAPAEEIRPATALPPTGTTGQVAMREAIPDGPIVPTPTVPPPPIQTAKMESIPSPVPVPAAPSQPPAASAPTNAPPAGRLKLEPLPADPLITKVPGISALIKLLPTPDDPVPPVADQPLAGLEVNEAGAQLLGRWAVEGLEMANAPGGYVPAATGTVVFNTDGSGMMNLEIDVIGQIIVRRGWFTWRADEKTLEINPGRERGSKWARDSGGSPGTQSARLSQDGLEVQLNLRRDSRAGSN